MMWSKFASATANLQRASNSPQSLKSTFPTMPKKKQDISFEQLYNELEATIEKLEEGSLTLDDALALYQRGMELAGECGTMLDRAELKIQELAPNARGLDRDEPDLDLDDDDKE